MLNVLFELKYIVLAIWVYLMEHWIKGVSFLRTPLSLRHYDLTFSELHSAPFQFPESNLITYCWWYDGILGSKEIAV